MNKYQIETISMCVAYAEAGEVQFNEWEEKFINDMSEKGKDYETTSKQNAVIRKLREKINRIY